MFVYELKDHGEMLFDSLKSVCKFIRNRYNFTQDDMLDACTTEDNFDITMRVKNSLFKIKKKMVFSSQKEDIKLANQVHLVLS